MSAQDLCQLEGVKSWLKLQGSNTAADAELSRLITSQSTAFFSEISRPDLFPAKDYTNEIHDSRKLIAIDPRNNIPGRAHTFKLPVRHWPLNAVTSITIDSVTFGESPDGIQNGWYFDETQDPEFCDSVLLVGPPFRGYNGVGWFPNTGSNVVITYNGGYAEVPGDIEQAVIEWVADRYTSKQFIGQTSKHMQSESVNYQHTDMPPFVKSVVERYKLSTSLL